jgi:hypothetical protein
LICSLQHKKLGLNVKGDKMATVLTHGYEIDDAGNLHESDSGKIIPWRVVHASIEWQKNHPINNRPDICICELCNQPILKAKKQEHMKAHG